MIEFKEQVSNAAKYLDEHNPGWYYSVNPDILNMRSCTKCIIGQVYGIPEQRIGAGLTWAKIMNQIFTHGWLHPEGFVQGVFACIGIEELWTAEINSRLAKSNEKEQCQILQTK